MRTPARVRLTKSQAEVLRILRDAAEPMITSTDTRAPYGTKRGGGHEGWVNGTSAAALHRRGWATNGDHWPRVAITYEGRIALRMWESQEEARNKADRVKAVAARDRYVGAVRKALAASDARDYRFESAGLTKSGGVG